MIDDLFWLEACITDVNKFVDSFRKGLGLPPEDAETKIARRKEIEKDWFGRDNSY